MVERAKRWYADTPRLLRHAGTELVTIVAGVVVFSLLYASGHGFDTSFRNAFIFGYLIPWAVLSFPQFIKDWGWRMINRGQMDEMEKSVWERSNTTSFAAATLYFCFVLTASVILFDNGYENLPEDYFLCILMGSILVFRGGWCASVIWLYSHGVKEN